MRKYKGYTIFKNGNILSKRGKPLYQTNHRCGYKQVLFYEDGKQKAYYVHRLVAMFYVENPNNYPCVNHKNGIKHDNRFDNLEWCTHKQNTKHAIESGAIVFKRGQEHKRSKKIKAIYPDGKEVIYYGTRDAEKKMNLNRKYICRVLSGKRNHHTGIIFKHI
jgi:hypothetical protein